MYVSGDINRIAQEALLDAVAGPAFFLDRDNRYLAFNEANKRAVHALYGVELAIGAKVEDVVTVDADRELLLANLARAHAGDTHTDGAWYGSDDAGRFYYTITYAPVRRHETVIGVAAVAVDGTELLRAREALERSQEKFGAAFMASPNAINLNRLSDGMYLEINQGFTSLTGYTSADVEGRSSIELSIWDDPADRARLVEGLKAAGSVDRLEALFRRKDGSVTVAEMSARMISVDGEPCIMSVTRDISERKASEEALEASHARLERMNRDVVETLGRVVETRDPYTQGHQERAARLCRQIAAHMGADEADIDILETSALVHDIGKLSVPAEILTKAGTLTPLEYAMIREHPRSTYDILKDIAFDAPIAEIALQHHERMDGSGYPDGLVGDAIHPSARILAVADVVEAMATHRPYRPALGLGAAAEELQQNPAKYDQAVVAAFISLYESGDIQI
jgi:PAS domain S-box-containing protein